MADTKISALTALTGTNTASGDVFPIVDVDANQTKKITRDEVKVALGLGTAAYTASTDYATSAQGSTADTAVQPGDDAADLGSGAATDGQVLTADGSGGAAWETVAGGGGDLVDDTTPQLGGDLDINGHSITGSAGTLTTDVKVLDLSATWNNAGVTFTGLKFNVTTTAQASASRVLDIQVNGQPAFTMGRDGILYVHATNGTAVAFFSRGGVIQTQSTGYFAINSTTGIGGSPDVLLLRDAAGTFAQRNGTNAQTSNLYRTYTDASNYQRLTKAWSTSTALIHNEGAGTSADGSIAFNDAALATDTTKGFIMIPSCAGAPTGTPADIPTGQIPIVFDSTNNKLYVYDGGWLSTAALT